MEICTLCTQTVHGLFTLPSSVPPVSNRVPVITITCHLASPPALSLHADCFNYAGAMNKSCLETETHSCFCTEISFISRPRFYLFFPFLQSVRLFTLSKCQRLAIISFQLWSLWLCACWCSHTLFITGAWPQFVSTKLLTISSSNLNSNQDDDDAIDCIA